MTRLTMMNAASLSTSLRSGFSAGKRELLAIGDAAPDFELADHEGRRRRLSSFRGRRVILSFYRFPDCPTCTFDVDRLRKQIEMFRRAGIVTLCIFKKPPSVIEKYSSCSASRNEDAFTLIDGKGAVYRAFMERKAAGGCVVAEGLNRLKHGADKFKHHADESDRAGELPADFLIDEDGVVVDLFRAEYEWEYMPYERIEEFIPEKRRCRCNKKDCIVPRCRENYAEIRKEASDMLSMGSFARFGESFRHSIRRASTARRSNVRTHARPGRAAVA